MLYTLAVLAGVILGFLSAIWARAPLPPPPITHDFCDERYDIMQQQLRAVIRSREGEIQRLLQGQS